MVMTHHVLLYRPVPVPVPVPTVVQVTTVNENKQIYDVHVTVD